VYICLTRTYYLTVRKMRTDPHRVGAIIPSDYTFVFWYDMGNGIYEPSVGVDCERPVFNPDGPNFIGKHSLDGRCCMVALQTIAHVPFADAGGMGKCSVCGANFRHGEVWTHHPTGEHVHVGHECAAKYSFVRDRSDWVAYQKECRSRRVDAAKEMRRAAARDAFLDANPDLKKAFEVKDQHPILTDMYAKLHRFGSLSEKQVAFALKLADEVRNPKPKVEEKHVPAPTGRVVVCGTVVSVKTVTTDFGDVDKMVVKVETPEGSWLVWVTVPNSITGDVRGKVVEFTATLTPGRDAHFAFGKRPTGGHIVE
jgi:hypothetical protein